MSDVFNKVNLLSADMKTATSGGPRPLYRVLDSRNGEALLEGRRVVMAACNDYLGLSGDPRVTQAAAQAALRFGTSCSASRLVGGTMPLHEDLEGRLAAFLGVEAAMVTTTGFQANLALAPLFGPGDVVFSDRANHASLVDAVQLGAAEKRFYRHSDMARLERQLSAADPAAGKVIVTDGVFSMEGDVCRLPDLHALAVAHHARLIVDGAHDIGLLGAGGRGVSEHFALPGAVDLYTGTFSKCFGSVGGVVAGSAEVIHFLRHTSRAMLFTAAMPPSAVAAALAALDIIETEPERRVRVFEVARQVNEGLRALGFDTGESTTPIIPVRMGQTEPALRLWQAVLDEGVFTSGVGFPAVPEGQALIRLSLQAVHTDAHVARILDAFAAAGRRLGYTCAPSPAPVGSQRADADPILAAAR
ncbi:aminotransferase class I/II-fold pyridoxal phosphate-dependent enzyme [Streptomyces sp. NPDC002779]|uniref:aminotransferase class I/II-fold pyridoxal phosphate-dependent enzyme n=1 Tax=Streptomyces sp. NPDC002779 TaxID=3364664 RepID=UPI0036C266F0